MSRERARARIEAALDELVESGAEGGVQVAVVHRGERVVDAARGVADPRTGAPVTADTLFWAASTAKGVTSSLARVLAERGDVRYDRPVADVWPGFGAHGTAAVTLRHGLLHTAGVPGPRVARQVPSDVVPPASDPGSPIDRAMPRAVVPDAALVSRLDVLTADIPSQGVTTARGAARLYAGLLGYVDGARLVSSQRLHEMAAVASTAMDEVMGFRVSWAFGYSPDRPSGVPSRPGSTFGMVGMNGSAAYADIDSGVAVAVMHNRFTTGDLSTVGRVDRIVADTLS